MSTWEESLVARIPLTGYTKTDHEEVIDIDHVSKPENYNRSDYISMQRAILAKSQSKKNLPNGNACHLETPGSNSSHTRSEGYTESATSSLASEECSSRYVGQQYTTDCYQHNASKGEGYDLVRVSNHHHDYGERHHDRQYLHQEGRGNASPSHAQNGGAFWSDPGAATVGHVNDQEVDKFMNAHVATTKTRKLRHRRKTFNLRHTYSRWRKCCVIKKGPINDDVTKQYVTERERSHDGAWARQKFVKMTRLIIVLNNWISVLRETEAGDDGEEGGKKKASSFADLALDASFNGLSNSGLTFDPMHYKAKKEINLSKEVKDILTTAPVGRTPAMIQQATLGLQHLRSFAEYPVHMQEKLAKVAFFQTVPAKRVIIRQGHTAENFYFVLSGHAAVTLLERNSRTGEPFMRTVSVLKRGWSFGELALLHHSKRTSTVVSQDNMQLLTIGRADFFKIFMSGTNPGDVPDHIKFISNLDFMKDWPLERLLEHPEMCLLHFYKRNVVITKDSTKSDWIYIIKAGTCQVMKQLKSVKPNSKMMTRTMKDETLRLPKLGTGEQSPRIDTRKKHSTRPLVMTPGIPQRSKTQLSEQFGVKGSIIDQLTNLQHEAIKDSLAILRIEKNPKLSDADAKCNFGEPHPRLTSFPSEERTDTTPGFSKSRFDKFPAIGAQVALRPVTPELENRKLPLISVTFDKEPISADKPKPTMAKFAANKWLAKAKGLPVPDEEEIEKRDELMRGESVFVQVELLKPRDVFGLTAMKFDDFLDIQTTKVSLVSRGAECIMLSKKFFIQHATDRVKENIKNLVRSYPSEKKLQENLQVKEDWTFYKRRLLSDVTDRLKTNSSTS